MFFVITDLIDNRTIFRESEASLCLNAVRAMSVEAVLAIVKDLDLGPRLLPPPAPGAGGWDPLETANLCDFRTSPIAPLLHWLLTVQEPETPAVRRLSLRLGLDPDAYVRQVRPYLTSEQIRTLHRQGFTIGAHSRDHRRLQDLPREVVEQEIIESCRIVRDITGQTSVPFAFPYFGGGLDRTWLARIRQENDFIGLFFDTGGLVEEEPFIVNRVFAERVGRGQTLDEILRSEWSSRPAWRRTL
jgi:peptidoglycan/xylan/chitin deacetylase (PgdA/CDA1 family)